MERKIEQCVVAATYYILASVRPRLINPLTVDQYCLLVYWPKCDESALSRPMYCTRIAHRQSLKVHVIGKSDISNFRQQFVGHRCNTF